MLLTDLVRPMVFSAAVVEKPIGRDSHTLTLAFPSCSVLRARFFFFFNKISIYANFSLKSEFGIENGFLLRMGTKVGDYLSSRREELSCIKVG